MSFIKYASLVNNFRSTRFRGFTSTWRIRSFTSRHCPLQLEVPRKSMLQMFQDNQSSIRTVQSYATSAKPHMTKSMASWKKKKRKTKAQQLREMENLQRDLVKMLSRRAIQVVQNKSSQGTGRDFVTSHAFNNLRLHDPDLDIMVVDPALRPEEQTSWDTLKVVDYKSDGIKSRPGKYSYHAQSYIHSNIEPPFMSQNNNSMQNTLEKEMHQKEFKFNTAGISPLDGGAEPIFKSKPINLSELFHDKPPTRLKPGNIIEIADYELAIKSFANELDSDNRTDFFEDSDINLSSQDCTIDRSNKETHSVHPLLSPTIVNETNVKETANSQVQTDFEESNPPPCSKSQGFKSSSTYVYGFQSEHFPKSPSAHSRRAAALPSIFIHDSSDDVYETESSPFSTGPSLNRMYQGAVNLDSPRSSLEVKPKRKQKGSPESSLAASASLSSTHQADSKGLIVVKEMKEMLDRSFVEACCFTGCELLAVRNIQYHLTKSKVSSVNIFNLLMGSLAKKNDLTTIKSLFMLLRQQGLNPNLQTYAACLECMGRMPEVKTQEVKNLIADVSKSGFDLKDIARRCTFQNDEWEFVLKAIQKVEADFMPHPLRFSTWYNNKLLKGLNTPSENAADSNQYAINISHEEMMERAKLQMDIEKKGDVKVRSIVPPQALKPKMRDLRNNLLVEWRKALLTSFTDKLTVYEKSAQDNINMTLYPFLKLLPPEDYINIIFKCLKDLLTVSAGYSPTLAMIRHDLGSAVNRKYNTALKVADNVDAKVMSVYKHYLEEFLCQEHPQKSHRVMWLGAMGQNYSTMNMDLSLKRWPGHITREIGSLLLDMILYDLKVDANTFKKKSPKRLVPAFSTMVMADKLRNTNAELKLHPVLFRLFAVDDSGYFSFAPSVVPMLVPPLPWISRNTGSLMLGSNALVRIRPSMGLLDPLKWVRENRYSSVLDSLNTLSACAWNINKPILDLQIEVFNNKGDAKLKISPPASVLPPLPVIKQDLPAKEKSVLYKERLALQQQRQDYHGLWCMDLYRLSIANKFRDEVFWFPHSMDFRGRTYPLPPHFNHLGSDNVRGVLLFAKGKPLGERGYDWLKIHLINLTGLKKRSSNAERLEYANSMMDVILDSADKPLTGEKWWQESDEPWQTLACCKEIAKIERYIGDKAEYICHFPVHQDGSCNGLQHYAAMGRDQAGAESVNLHPFDAPKDVYSDVVELVEKARQAHAEEGKEIAQVLEGFIKRKVIKQTIMTTVYGVTRYGAREQIHRQLKDIPDFPEEEAWRASMYLTHTTFSCLREMFTAAKDIQDWLTEAANLISAFAPVDWVTPLGFPVLQPYYKRVGKNGDTSFDRFKPNTMKQKNAFPPNYIHSLDSTHMMLTALYCVHAGITFVSVHDCYWTHACDVPIMNRICREQFVNMHKQPLLEDLSQHLIALVNRAGQDPQLVEAMKKVDVSALIRLLNNVPKRGTFDLDNVLRSTYFFS